MSSVHINNLDLNLLRTFEALFEERSATRAALRLGVTQSAVSHGLSRLRYALGDPLFARAAGGLRPTPRAAEIAPQLIGALRQLASALAPAAFTPSSTTRRFVIEAGPYVSAVLLPEVVRRVREAAPGAGLGIRNSGAAIAEALDAGRADVALGSFPGAAERFARAPLFEDRLVWVVRADHPAVSSGLDLEGLLRLPQILIAMGDGETQDGDLVGAGVLERRTIWDDGAVRRAFAERGLERRVAVTVPDTQTALAILARSDMTAFIPSRFAKASLSAAGAEPLRFVEPQGGDRFEISLLWRADREDPGLAWLKGVILDCGAALQGGAP